MIFMNREINSYLLILFGIIVFVVLFILGLKYNKPIKNNNNNNNNNNNKKVRAPTESIAS